MKKATIVLFGFVWCALPVVLAGWVFGLDLSSRENASCLIAVAFVSGVLGAAMVNNIYESKP